MDNVTGNCTSTKANITVKAVFDGNQSGEQAFMKLIRRNFWRKLDLSIDISGKKVYNYYRKRFRKNRMLTFAGYGILLTDAMERKNRGGTAMDEKMMLFMGTGAAEGIPTPFCRCRICENARKKGGREVRMRSCFRVSRELMIDFGPDLFSSCIKTGTDLYDLKHLLITHTHADHLDIGNLFLKQLIGTDNGEKLHIYLNGDAYEILKAMDRMGFYDRQDFFTECLKQDYEFHKLEFFKSYRIGEYEVTPVKGEHPAYFEKNAAGYLIRQQDGMEFLYALDTGYYSEETLDFLKGRRLELLILECTFGSAGRGDKPYSHLDLHSCLTLCDRLFDQGTLKEDAQVYLTHINQVQDYTHEDLERLCRGERLTKPYKIYAAYDGLRLTDEGMQACAVR